jgi:hypothetical protein
MRHFSLFEYLSYGEEFWNDVEGRAADRPTCPFCHLEGLEKEEREVDHRTDVWRCRNCQHRVSDDDLLRVASIGDLDDEEPFITIDIQDSLLGGIFDVLTLGQRMDWIAESEADDLFDYLDYVYGNAQEMGENIVQLKLDADNYEILKRVFSACKGYSKDNELWREIIAENEDLDFIDIGDAWVVFNQAETSPSSAENLEAIPTMENENAPMGEEVETSFGNCPQCGVDAVDPAIAQCTNCGWDQDNACPECFSDRSLYLEEDGSKHCNNCGWNDAANQPGALPPATPAGKEQTNQDPLEQQFNMPSAEHPLGPHTGADSLDNQYYSIPIDMSGNEPLAVSIFLEWGDTYNLIPEGFMESDILSKDDQGNTVFSLTGESHKIMFNLCQVFLGYAQQDMNRLIQSMIVLDTMGVIIPETGLDYTTDPDGVVNMIVELIKDITNFIIKFTNTNPSPSSQANLEDAFNAPATEHPLGPYTGSNQELYTSGGFVKGPDGRWLVAINPSGGQRDPEPGDWATIQQRTKSFNRPVPLTLVEDMGGAWKFRNGHHPNIESQAEDETF